MTGWWYADLGLAFLGFFTRKVGTSRPVNVALGSLIVLGGGISVWSGLHEVSQISNFRQHGVVTEASRQHCYGASIGCDFTYKAAGVTYNGGPEKSIGEYLNFQVRYLPSNPKEVRPVMFMSDVHGYVMSGVGAVLLILGLGVAILAPTNRPGYLDTN